MSSYGERLDASTVRFERRLTAPIDVIWAYLTDGEKRSKAEKAAASAPWYKERTWHSTACRSCWGTCRACSLTFTRARCSPSSSETRR